MMAETNVQEKLQFKSFQINKLQFSQLLLKSILRLSIVGTLNKNFLLSSHGYLNLNFIN